MDSAEITEQRGRVVYPMSYFEEILIRAADSASIDSFDRLRVSEIATDGHWDWGASDCRGLLSWKEVRA